MSGKNVSILNLPPGVFRNASQYAAGKRWYNVNLVRWFEDILVPVGGWVKTNTLASGTQPVRKAISWRDLLKDPWFALGAADKLWGAQVLGVAQYVFQDITPSGLGWNPGGGIGYGRAAYGSGGYGVDDTSGVNPDSNALWSLDNFGKVLVGVHSQDGRLVSWDPSAAPGVAAPVANAPLDNQIVITTEEEYVMVMGGKNNPRRVQWASKRTLTEWSPTPTNSAGTFDLRTSGAIVSAVRVNEGILVVTDSDVHMIEYIGPPDYYGRRRISEEGGCIGQNCAVATPRGVIWLGGSNFWLYNGSVSRVPCSVSALVFYQGDISQSHLVHMGINEYAQELWINYPMLGDTKPGQYAFISYANDYYWSYGALERTAWMNPVWQRKPIAVNGLDIYSHEVGSTNDGVSRNGTVFAETGAMEIGDGDEIMKIDRIYPDISEIAAPGLQGPDTQAAVDAVTMTFKLRQAPDGPEHTYGPVSLNNAAGYSTVRMRARQVVMRIDQIKDTLWRVGKLRVRAKPSGKR